MKSRKLLFGILVFLIIMGAWSLLMNLRPEKSTNKRDILGVSGDEYSILVGDSPSTFTRFPTNFVFADSTTTVTANVGSVSSEGGVVNQLVNVDGFTDYTFYADLQGGTATSTACVRPMWSFDNTNYYSLNTAATTTDGVATTTPNVVVQSICFDPGTATTTWMFTGKIPAARSARFILWGEDVSTDPSDGVEGHATVNFQDLSGHQ